MEALSNHDYRVIATAQDALRAKHAAVQAGYYQDPYLAPFFVAARPQRPVQVIIKRGTFARVACVERVVSTFLDLVAAADGASNRGGSEDEKSATAKTAAAAQVLVLGAGKDTSFFRLLSNNTSNNTRRIVRWFEVDHDPVFREKAATIQQSPTIFGGTTVHKKSESVYELTPTITAKTTTSSCHWIAHDLKEDPTVLLQEKLIAGSGFDPHCPTLVVVECVQMYLPVAAVDAIWRTLATTCTDCHVCSYEPILDGTTSKNSRNNNPSAFGRMMEGNLTQAGVVEPDSCLVQRRTLTAYLASLVHTDSSSSSSSGATSSFRRAVGCNMHTAYETLLTAAQRQRANRCEFLDELEEWVLIMQHYGLVVASNNLDSTVGRALTVVVKSSSSSSSNSNNASGCGFVEGRCQELEK